MIKLFEARGLRYIDVLCLSDSERLDDVRRILSKLALWGIDNQYSYIRLLTFHRRLSDFLRINLKTVARPHRFTYFSTEPQILEQLRRVWISLGLRAKGHDLLTISACEVRPKPGQPIALVEGA